MKWRSIFIIFGIIFTFSPEAKQSRITPWGFYQIYWHPKQFEKQLDKTLAELGGKPRYCLFFRDLNPKRPYPAKAIEICHKRGLIPVISLELWDWHRTGYKHYLRDIQSGFYNDFFKKWGKAARSAKDTVMLRFGFEMNGDWFTWGGQPRAFIKAYRHAYSQIMQSRPKRLVWMFSPNVLWADKTFEQNIRPYYPGDAYVDMIGLDGYNFGDNHSKDHQWRSYHQVFEKTISTVQVFKKPVMITEIGCADDERKAIWLQNFLVQVQKDRRIRGFIYFNYDKRRENQPNWAISSDGKSLKIFRNLTDPNM